MVLDGNTLKEKLIEAWKLRSNEISFSASLSSLIAECRSEEEFRTLFTTQILTNLDSAISSNLLQSYFKFHTRSGYINESLVIDRLLSLRPSSSVFVDDIPIKFLVELLYETLKTLHITAAQAPRLGKQLNSLAQWLCSALCFYSNQLNSNEEMNNKGKEMLILVSNLFLLLFTNTTYYCLWLMTIKAQKEQNHWRELQEQVSKQIRTREIIGLDVYEQILFKITRLHLSEEFHQEDIEFNTFVFNPIVSTLVINQLHQSSSILLLILRFYEHVSTTTNPSLIYVRFLQASFGGYVSSISTNNSEYQQRWSAFIHFQLPRILASCLETQFDAVKQSIETFFLHNEYLLNRMDKLCVENSFEQIFRTTLSYTKQEIQEKYANEISQLIFYIQQIRRHYIEQVQIYQQKQQTHSYPYQILQSQRSLEKSLHEIFLTPNKEGNLENLIMNLTDYIPLICALDQYHRFIRLLLSYTQTQFDLALYVLCYVTSITDDTSEDFGQIEMKFGESSSPLIVYIWLKKYWLSRHLGQGLFASSLNSIEFLGTNNNSFEVSSAEREEFLMDMKSFNDENIPIKYSNTEYLSKTISLLGELQSLSLNETKEILIQLMNYLTHVSYGSLLHVLLWLIANYQIANDDERPWIQNFIHTMGATADSTSTVFTLLDAIKRQLWSHFIDNPLLPFHPLNANLSSSSIINTSSLSSSQTSTTLIQSLFDAYAVNDFLDSEQSRALYICSKYVPTNSIIIRLLTHINTSNGIYETSRALNFIFSLLLFRRRSSTRCFLTEVLPYLYNIKSNEFMLEPNVYSTSLILNVLLMLEFIPNNDQLEDLFRMKSWKKISPEDDNVLPHYEDRSVADAYHSLLNYSSEEMFSKDTLRPVNYFLGWFQTILWMFSRTAKSLKPFVKTKLIAQLSEYLPLQFPIEKVLSISQLSSYIEIEYASMVITRDYSALQTLGTRTTTTLVQKPPLIVNENNVKTPVNLINKIFLIPTNL